MKARKHRSAKAHSVRRWMLHQRILGYTLLVVCFLSILTYVSQGIEVKNVAYAMQSLIKQKRSLLEEKGKIELVLLEQQSFDRLEESIGRFELPLEPGPRLEIVLREDRRAFPSLGGTAQEEEMDSWRSWLARLNQAQAMMTSGSPRNFGWRAPIVGQVGRTTEPSEDERKTDGS